MSAVQLTQWLNELHKEPFSWSSWHCCHFASSWVKYVKGVDIMADKPVVSDFKTAKRALKAYGGDLTVAISQQLGKEPQSASMARVGDIVLLPAENDEGVGLVGVCNGRVSFFLDERGGIASIPTERAQCSWAI